MTALTTTLFDAVGEFAWKGAVLLLVCRAALWCIARGHAASRAHVLELGFAGLVLLPIVALLLPAWHVALPIDAPGTEPRTTESRPVTVERERAPSGSPPMIVSLTPRTATDAPTASPMPTPPSSGRVVEPATVLLGLWMLGALLLLGRLAHGRRRCFGWMRSARPAGALATRLTERLRRTYGIERDVLVIENDRSASPGTFGTFRPVIVLPSAATDWSEERLRAVLLHELAHVARWDAARQLVARIALALHWFNPLAWSALRLWSLERERACDDQVLARGVRASDYATHLVEIAASGTSLAEPSLAMTDRSFLETRVVALLEAERTDETIPWRTKMLRTMTFLALLLPLSALALAPQDAPLPDATPAVPASDAKSPQSIGLEELLELQRRGVTPQWLRGMRGVIEDPSVDVLVQLHDHGVTPELVAATLSESQDEVDADALIALFTSVTDSRPEDRAAAPAPESPGHEGFSREEQLELRARGITVEYHRRMIEALDQRPSVKELVTLRESGVDPEFARVLSETYRVSVDEIADAVSHGVGPKYVKRVGALLPTLELDDLVELSVHGVAPELVEAALGQDDEIQRGHR